MRLLLALSLAAYASLPVQPAWACPPPIPGSVPPSEEEQLEAFVGRASDIVYGVVTRSAAPGEPVSLEVLHAYKGDRKKGETIEAVVNWDYPVPFCAGMMQLPPTKPVGAYGVVAFNSAQPSLVFFGPQDVEAMIGHGLIESARGR